MTYVKNRDEWRQNQPKGGWAEMGKQKAIVKNEQGGLMKKKRVVSPAWGFKKKRNEVMMKKHGIENEKGQLPLNSIMRGGRHK